MYKMSNFNVSNGWVIGCSILTCGILTHSYLNGLGNIPPIHMKNKYRLELLEIDKSIDLSESKKNHDEIISYYCKHINIIYIMGITGLSIIAFRSRL